jgi:hypothetical protein
MYRIDNANATTVLPTPLAPGPVVHGYFQSGNPSTGQKATTVDRDWANTQQEEIANVVEAAGITLSKTDRTQLLQAIRSIAAGAGVHGQQGFNTSGNFTWPVGVSAINVEVWGPGGCSCAGNPTGSLASGGAGSGGYSRKRIVGVTAGTVIPVTVGTVGSAGTTVALPAFGTGSSFGAYCSASSPVDNAAWTLADPSASGSPGVGATGDLNLTGSWGTAAFATINGSGNCGGSGGAAPHGGGAVSGNVGSSQDGSFPGGGAGGVGASTTVGRRGGAGYVLVTW